MHRFGFSLLKVSLTASLFVFSSAGMTFGLTNTPAFLAPANVYTVGTGSNTAGWNPEVVVAYGGSVDPVTGKLIPFSKMPPGTVAAAVIPKTGTTFDYNTTLNKWAGVPGTKYYVEAVQWESQMGKRVQFGSANLASITP